MDLFSLFLLLGSSAVAMGDTFRYFAYGSNLLAERIHLNNPTAVRTAIGKLEDFRLDFDLWAEGWNGSVATIVPHTGSVVWGALWEIDSSNLADLDRQEGVHLQMYFARQVDVVTPDGEVLNCRTYQITQNPEAVEDGGVLPENRRPSKTYLDIIIRGAIESGLPTSYIDDLRRIPDNGKTGVIPDTSSDSW